jgi:hypothetical protein
MGSYADVVVVGAVHARPPHEKNATSASAADCISAGASTWRHWR